MRGLRRDSVCTSLTALAYGSALGVLSVMVPLAALDAGYGPVIVGLLATLTATTQLLVRTVMGALMRLVTDRALIAASALLIAAAAAVLVLSATLPAFLLAQVLHGVARAFFWTGAQTHAVRTARTSVRGLTLVSLTAGTGQFAGPAVAGVVSQVWSGQWALATGVGLGLVAFIPALGLDWLPPFARPRRAEGPRFIWMQPGVGTGCLMTVSAGGWKSLLDSYVPVALVAADQSDAVIGVVVGIANVAVLVGSGVAPLVRRPRLASVLSILATAAGLGLAGLAAPWAVLAAAALFVSGTGAGLLQTLGPAVAADAVEPNRRGDAIAATGISRSLAFLAAPVGMAGAISVLPLAGGFLAAGAALLAPLLLLGPAPRGGPNHQDTPPHPSPR